MASNGELRNRFPTRTTEIKNQNAVEERPEQQFQNIVQQKLEELRQDVLRDISSQLNPETLMEAFRQKMEMDDSSSLLDSSSDTKDYPEKHTKKGNDATIGRDFVPRESELTVLLNNKHIAPIYNIFVAALIAYIISTVTHDIINTGSINLGFNLLSYNFKEFPQAFPIWASMIASTIALYYVYLFWASVRSILQENKSFQMVVDKVMLFLFVAFLVLFLIIPTTVLQLKQLPFAMCMYILCEQVRLFMKTYSFVRSNVPRTLEYKSNSAVPYFAPTFSQFIYFQFAPTLIYRDHYPRSRRIRWEFALMRFFEVFCVILFIGFLAETYFIPSTRDFGKPGVSLYRLIPTIIDNCVPGIAVVFLIFYAVLHAWMNGMAEILRFSDRLFYRDWWNKAAYGDYYKTWNVVVYDWLYTFVYKDAGSKLFKKRESRAFLVIFFSAFFHEYIMVFGLGFCLPVFIIMYGFGGPMMFFLGSKNWTAGNILLWFTLWLGTSILFTLYFAEHYTRVNCPKEVASPLVDFFVPRLLTCPYS